MIKITFCSSILYNMCYVSVFYLVCTGWKYCCKNYRLGLWDDKNHQPTCMTARVATVLYVYILGGCDSPYWATLFLQPFIRTLAVAWMWCLPTCTLICRPFMGLMSHKNCVLTSSLLQSTTLISLTITQVLGNKRSQECPIFFGGGMLKVTMT